VANKDEKRTTRTRLQSVPALDHIEAVAPGRRHPWDVDAALVRVAGGSAGDLHEQLRRIAFAYRAEEDAHLSFDEVQTLVEPGAHELPMERHAHAHGCAFCRELIDTIDGSATERDAFLELVRQHEVAPAPVPQKERSRAGLGRIPTPARARFEPWAWPLAAAATAATTVAVVAGVAFHPWRSTPSPQALVANTPPIIWSQASRTCKQESPSVSGCDLFTAAARLTTEGQDHLARPVLVSALRESGLEGFAVDKIDATLATAPNSSGAPPQNSSEARPVQTTAPTSKPDTAISARHEASEHLLISAKADFEAGRPVQGYEGVATYAAAVTERPDVARAVRVGFIEPVREAEKLKVDAAARTASSGTAVQMEPAK
jgi:hypothetical protein